MAQNGSENGYGYDNGSGSNGVYGSGNAYGNTYGSGYGAGYGGGGVYGYGNTLLDLADILWKRKIGMMTVFIIILGVSIIVTYMQTPIFQVFATLMVNYGRENTYHSIEPFRQGDDSRPQYTYNNDQTISTMLEVARSNKVIESTLGKVGVEKMFPELTKGREIAEVMPAAINRFRNNLDASQIKGSKVLAIKLDHDDPRVAVAALEILVQEFKDRHIEIFKNPQTAFLEKQTAEYFQKYKDAEGAVQAFKKANDIYFLQNQQAFLTDYLMRTKSDFIDGLTQANSLREKLSVNEENLKSIPELSVVYETTGEAQNLNQLRYTLLDLQLKEADLSQKYPEHNRLVREARQKVKLAQEYIDKVAADDGNHEESTQTGKTFAYQQLEYAIFKNQSDLKGRLAANVALENEVKAVEKRLQELTEKSVELKHLEILSATAEKTYRDTLANYEDHKIMDMLDQEKIINIVDIEKPVLPLKPIKPRKRINLMIGLILAAVSAFAYALLFEYSAMKRSATAEI